MGTYSESIKEIENLFRDLNYLKRILLKINDIATREGWSKISFHNTLCVNVQIEIKQDPKKPFDSSVSCDFQENIPFKEMRVNINYVESIDYNDSLILKVFLQEKKAEKKDHDKREFWNEERRSVSKCYNKKRFDSMPVTATCAIPLSVYSSMISSHYSESFVKRIANAIIDCAKAVLIDNDLHE